MSKEMELQQQLPLRKKMKDTSNNVPEATFHYQIADDERSCCKHVLFLEQKKMKKEMSYTVDIL